MKDSIKREQSQAGLSFAERLRVGEPCSGMRKNFRPKVKRNKLLLLLALLMTAATGAWADNTVTWEGATLKSVNVASYENNKTQTIGDITVTANSGYFKDFGSGNDGVIASAYETNGLVFSANAKFKSVEVTASSESTFNHTSGSATSHTYTVNPTATSFALPYGDGWINITKIVFTFEDAAAEPAGYTVSMKSGVKDADKWTVKVGEGQAQALPIGGLKGDGSETVTLQYNGRLKVKGVKATSDAAPAAPSVDLSTLTADYEAQDGEVLTGTLGANVKISIADGATVTLKNLSINASGTWTSGNHAGITCPGNATISLEGTNTVKGFYEDYPGIHIAKGKTLYIKGSGTLTAIGGGYGAGIGGGYDISCGNIEIQDGTVNAQGGRQAAGIGSGVYYSKSSDCGTITISGGTVNATGGVSASGIGSGDKGTCSDITISGGTVNATGGENNSNTGTGAGIGSGRNGTCGNITIANTVTKVTATAGPNAPYSIGKGSLGGSCGTVTIGGTKYWENNAAVNGGDTYLATSPLIYQP